MIYFLIESEIGGIVKKHSKEKIRFLVLSTFLVGLVCLSVASIFKDWLAIASNKQEIASLTQYYSDLLEEEESLNSEVTKLHDTDYIARYAREKYMYSLPGEYIIKIPEE